MLENCDVQLNADYLNNKEKYKYFDYKLGELDWRSLRFEEKILDC